MNELLMRTTRIHLKSTVLCDSRPKRLSRDSINMKLLKRQNCSTARWFPGVGSEGHSLIEEEFEEIFGMKEMFSVFPVVVALWLDIYFNK